VVPAYPGCPGSKAVKWSLLLIVTMCSIHWTVASSPGHDNPTKPSIHTQSLHAPVTPSSIMWYWLTGNDLWLGR